MALKLIKIRNLVASLKNITLWLTKLAIGFTGVPPRFIIQLNITNACNLRCKHCYHPDHIVGTELTFDQWRQVLDEYDQLLARLGRSPRVILCGGEPFVSPLLVPLAEEIFKRYGVGALEILTNGTLCIDKAVETIAPYKPTFQVSIDGPDAARHDQTRGAGSFEKALAGIKTLRKAGLPVHVLAILSKKSSNWIPEFFKLAQSLDVDSMNFVRLVKQGNAQHLVDTGADRPLNSTELKAAYGLIVHESELKNTQTYTGQPLFHLIRDDLGGNDIFGLLGVVIDPDGGYRVSSRVSLRIGNVLKDSLPLIFFNHPLMKALRNKKNYTVCGKCKYWAQCGGSRNAAYAEFEDYFAPDPGCWFAATEIAEYRSKYKLSDSFTLSLLS